MLLITCPHCGPRSEIEFRYGGESHIQRPGPYGDVTDEAWADYLFYRSNPKGEHRERWMHAAGCRRWFNIVRDTVTHRIVTIYPMGEAPDAALPR
ncbi:MAG: sarcosine oxidase subunit delta [Pseudomonadota bacterium]|uniref:sarcosine oxidase subunit delta n=1 Tax=Sphingomonas sp. ERG5 TaxID=1381597 RepID=UPI00054C64ED|nr:sarcosine oxidase subunit delta [Sphingomonas sp. ERG5]